MIRYESRPNPTSIIAAKPRGCARSHEERMADDMREMAFAGQNVSIETLVERGWTRKTVLRFYDKARTIARRLSVRQVA